MKLVQVISILCLLNSCADNKKAENTSLGLEHEKRVTNAAFQSILDDAAVQGSLLIYDSKADTYYSNNFDWSNKGQLPASTFKIPNSIIALESEVVESDSTLFEWDGQKRAYKMWERDLIFKEAFHLSCVPCYQQIARKVGVNNMKSYLNKLQYGNILVDSATIDNFWLRGKSKVSQFEQISFLKKFYNKQLPISERTDSIMRRMMIIDDNGELKISGKTGWSTQNEIDNGWFVGYVESSTNVLYFATNIEPKEKFDMTNFPNIRKEVTFKALRELGTEFI